MLEITYIPIYIAAVFGSVITSFLVHEYDNYGSNHALLKFRSECDHCKKQLKAINLIPIFSYIFQRGRSSCCQKKLKLKYPIFETLGALFFSLAAFAGEFFTLGLLIPVLFLIIFIDEKYQEIPLAWNIFVFLWCVINGDIMANALFASILLAILLAIYFGYKFLRNQEGFGLGDIILLFSCGLYLGFPNAIYLITISSSLLILKIIISQKYKDRHAFGSWIAGVLMIIILFLESYESVSSISI